MAQLPVRKKYRDFLDAQDEDFFDTLLERMAGGLGAWKQAQEIGIPYTALMGWVKMDDDRNARFVQCEALYAQKMVEDSMEIADAATNEDGFIAKLKIDTRLRIAGKLDARFGNGPAVAVNGNNVQVVLTSFADAPGLTMELDGSDGLDEVRRIANESEAT